MGWRTEFENRCARCWLWKPLCICAHLPRIDTKTKVFLLIHNRETKRPSNTGRLAKLILNQCEVRVRGLNGAPMESRGLVEDARQPLLLFPAEDAVELTAAFVSKIQKPVSLIVPDGNWRQASRVPQREKSLAGIPRVKIPLGKASEYRLRLETRNGGLATFEAIARALGVLEGAEIQEKMEKAFRLMVERTLWARRKIPLEECEFGIPSEAIC